MPPPTHPEFIYYPDGTFHFCYADEVIIWDGKNTEEIRPLLEAKTPYVNYERILDFGKHAEVALAEQTFRKDGRRGLPAQCWEHDFTKVFEHIRKLSKNIK